MNGRIGQQLGNYHLLQKLGSGGFAEVYLGKHIYLDTQAAIKVLSMQLADHEMENFSQEARTIANLKHPHIISVLDFGIQESTGTPFLVMDYAPNGTLRRRFARRSRGSLTQIFPYIQQTAEALQFAHDVQLIHRDVKPENILLTHNHMVLLSDFGLAVVAQSSRHQESLKNAGAGTIAYTAPEQSEGRPCFASDQYSLAIIVYEMLCGKRPFSGTPIEIMMQHAKSYPQRMRDFVPALPSTVELVVQKALAKDPKQRFDTICEFSQALEEASRQTKRRSRTTRQLHSSGNTTVPFVTDSPTVIRKKRTASVIAAPPENSSVIWNVPHRRNPFFTGREYTLASLHEKLHSGKTLSSIQAIRGLSGSGKTQIAVEYAYRHHTDYRVILWLRADRRDMLRDDCATIVKQLGIEKDGEPEIEIVKSWLKANTDWLLILDNLENLSLLRNLLPANLHGHVLLTTHTQATGTIAQHIDLYQMEPDEAILFLLRRIKKLSQDDPLLKASQSDAKAANELAEALGYLPLALDQAGAYIEETGCSLNDYLSLYSTNAAKLLKMRGSLGMDHPISVAAAFTQAFEKVEQASASAIELLRFCAFLDPLAIPEEFFRHAAEELGTALQPVAHDPLALDAAIAALRKYSLVQRVAETKLLSLHPLVQVILKDRMSETERREWVERTVRAVNRAFPALEDLHTWHFCQLAMPQVHICIALIQHYQLRSREAVRLLYQASLYARIQAQYQKTESLIEQAAAIQQHLPATNQDEMALSIAFWQHYKRRPDAVRETSIQKELACSEEVLGSDSPHVAMIRLRLAELYYRQGNYREAEQLFLQSLSIEEQRIGLLHARVACTFNGLGLIWLKLGKYSLAQTYLNHALAIWEQVPEPTHPYMGRTLNALARLAIIQGKYAQAELHLNRERMLFEQSIQMLNPLVIRSINEWAILSIAQGRYDQVGLLLDQAQTLAIKTGGPKHFTTARVRHTYAQFYYRLGKYAQAESLLQEVLNIREPALGVKHPDVASTINTLADVYVAQGQYSLAEALYKQALEAREEVLGLEHPDVAETISGMANLSFKQTKYQQAEQYYKQALAIREKVFGGEHPDVAQTLHDLAELYKNRKRYDEAEPLFRKALAIREKMLGPEHIEVSTTLQHLSFTLWMLGWQEEASICKNRAMQIRANYAHFDGL